MTEESEGIVLSLQAVKIKGLSKAIGEAVIGAAQTAWAAVEGNPFRGVGAVGAFFKAIGSVEISDSKERLACLLVAGALARALEKTLESDEITLTRRPTAKEAKELAKTLLGRLGDGTVHIEASFLDQPREFEFLKTFASDVVSQFGEIIHAAHHSKILPKIRQAFLPALDRVWASKPQEFAIIEKALNTPFSAALARERERRRYLANLVRNFEERQLAGQDGENDPVLLSDVFLPLRAWHADMPPKQTKDGNERAIEGDGAGIDRERVKRQLVEFDQAVYDFVAARKSADSVLVVSGGPGMGKSSSLAAVAAELATNRKAFPLFLPLQRMSEADKLEPGIENALKTEGTGWFKSGFFEEHFGEISNEHPVVIIFDGLDELVKAGEAGDQVTMNFIRDVNGLLDRRTHGTKVARVLAIVSGRIAAAEKAYKQAAIGNDRMLHFLPFNLEKHIRETFTEGTDTERLEFDQRPIWWAKWHARRPDVPTELPEELVSSELKELSLEPLLLYFMAFVEAWTIVEPGGRVGRNSVYDKVLREFHKRECAKKISNLADTLKNFDEAYEPVLQALALAAWYDGSTRQGSIDDVTTILESQSDELLKAFLDTIGANPAFGASLAFQMRPTEGKNTYEFLHKTFAEYLVSRHFADFLSDITQRLGIPRKGRGRALSSNDLENELKVWLRTWGARAIDHDVLIFMRSEVALRHRDHPYSAESIEAIARLMRHAMQFGLPAHEIRQGPGRHQIATFAQMTDWARNGEETLLLALNAMLLAADGAFGPVSITAESRNRHSMGNMLSRLLRQREQGFIAHQCLSHLDFSQSTLFLADLEGANLRGTHLNRALLFNADLSNADLEGANLREANLTGASLIGANLREVNLTGASLNGASLISANLREANLTGAILNGAHLNGADLIGALLIGANLSGANFSGANLYRADLSDADLSDADLLHADLSRADLRRSKFLDMAQLPEGWSATWDKFKKRWNIETPDGPYVDPNEKDNTDQD